MKKLYSKFLLLILLSFSFVQKVLAEKIGDEMTFGIIYSLPDMVRHVQYPETILSRMIGVLVLLLLAFFSTTTIAPFLYLKLRKMDTTKIKSLLRLGGLSLLTIAFLELTLFQLKNLDKSHYSFELINKILNDKTLSISAALSVLSLFTFIYYLLRTMMLFIAKKIKQRKKIIP